ncbi:Uncharacterized protein APZ42_001545 [Daphnia magna]|uniref:Uncharacterized protein n=1 Tax=Daphnia magna TaxID=35525 RepID=A0A164IWQ1_9CRUS|nr:Uncharacterized protein APZ42_001545 [Daphnia magna]
MDSFPCVCVQPFKSPSCQLGPASNENYDRLGRRERRNHNQNLKPRDPTRYW